MNVLYIDIDSLRPDHLGTYGYNKPTTPNIDEFATDAVQFNRAYAADTPCLPSRASWLSGRYGINTGVSTHGKHGQVLRSPHNWKDWLATWSEDWTTEGRNALAEDSGDSADWQTLPELFFHHRIRTAAVSSFPRHPAPWFYHLWHEYYHPQEPDASGEYMQTPRAETVSNHATNFIDSLSDEAFFLYLQFWEPHLPYNRDEAEVDRFRDDDLPPYPTNDQIDEHSDWTPSSAVQIGVSDRSDLADIIAKYDAEIRHVDHYVGEILSLLKDRGLYDDTLITITADHGEEFGEHGLYSHHWSTHDGTQRVPLLVKPPADAPVAVGERDQLITNVDMPPTIADYAGFDTPAMWQGQSIRPIIEQQDTDWRDHIVVDHGLYTAQRAVRTDRWKYIRTYHPGLYDEAAPDHQLYDMQNDPWEQQNRIEDHQSDVEELQAKMIVWAENHVGRFEDGLKVVARNGPTHTKWEYWDADRS